MGQIHVHNLGKRYRRYHNKTARLLDWLLPGYTPPHSDHWVLRNLSFVVNQGESVGIVGMNGAGKSTLLKMITGTGLPTEGHVRMQGRVAALLELGMGFHAEFTGRQNAMTALQLLGHSATESESLLAAVVEFAEIGDYFDQPIRMYSSGMQIRLAFSVATAVRPDILIVDEALSVGDTYFQHKSFDRIRQFNALGTTLLLVSHDKSAIQSICNRALLLHKGSILREGPPDTVFDLYNALIAENGGQVRSENNLGQGKSQITSGTGGAIIYSAELCDAESGAVVDVVRVGQTVKLRLAIEVRETIPKLVMGYCIKDRLGQDMYGTNTQHTQQTLLDLVGGDQFTIEVKFNANLGEGSYSVSTALTNNKDHLHTCYFWKDLHVVFEVINADQTSFVGCNWMPPSAIEIKPNP
jgi:lipopolysaccharide transport system ATP-binding protein